jgi:hypothetical protein
MKNLGWFQILAELCRDFGSLNDVSHLTVLSGIGLNGIMANVVAP